MWFLYALAFALISSIGTIIAKKILFEADEYSYIWLGNIFSLPFLLAIILLFYQIPRIDATFGWAMAGSITLDVVAAFLAYRAIKISEISLINPMSAFNPVFTAIISFIVLGERVPLRGVFGILLIVAGAYLLQASKKKKGWLAPFRSLFAHKGVRLSLLAYFIWSITPIFQKTAITHTLPQVPPFASLVGMFGMTVVYTPIVKKFSKKPVNILRKYYKLFILAGLLTGIAQTSAFMAFSLTKLGLATAVFKLSMIFTVIFGWLFFKEKNIKDRLLGSAVMLTGVVLLVS